MDVRCERCKSEYEVEDANVSDLGTEVQCSDCGHQFVVKRPPTTAPSASTAKAGRASDGEESGSWVIETATGRSLRLRDLTTLHKWIIERRVGRVDRLSRGGDPWQRLGDMAELAPFFDIVDSAERARSADTPLPAGLPALLALPVVEPPVAQPAPPERRPVAVVSAPPRPLVSTARAATGPLPSSLYDSGADETVIVRQEPAKPRILLKLLLAMLVATVVAYVGILLWQHHRRGSAMISSSGSSENTAPPAAPPTPTKVESTEAAEESTEGGGPSHGPVVEPMDNGGPGEKVPLLGKGAKHVVASRTVAAHRAKAPSKPQGAQASTAKSNAPPSLAAQGYVALNHHQPSRAIALFKRALASNPTNGTALFGLAEAHRIAGQSAPALQAYRKYVDLLPSGPDAGSARYQIRLLENKRR